MGCSWFCSLMFMFLFFTFDKFAVILIISLIRWFSNFHDQTTLVTTHKIYDSHGNFTRVVKCGKKSGQPLDIWGVLDFTQWCVFLFSFVQFAVKSFDLHWHFFYILRQGFRYSYRRSPTLSSQIWACEILLKFNILDITLILTSLAF